MPITNDRVRLWSGGRNRLLLHVLYRNLRRLKLGGYKVEPIDLIGENVGHPVVQAGSTPQKSS